MNFSGMTIDFIFHHAQNASRGSWLRNTLGIPANRLQAQLLLLDQSSKADHMKYLTLNGLSGEIRKQALEKWMSSGIKVSDIAETVVSCKDPSSRVRLINYLGPNEKPNPCLLGYILNVTHDERDAKLAVQHIISITEMIPSSENLVASKASKEAIIAAFTVLEAVALTSQLQTVAMLAFEQLRKKNKLKPKYAIQLSKDALTTSVRKAAKKLL